MLWVCLDCTTAYAPDAPCCPHCASTRHVEQGSAEHLAMAQPPASAPPAAAGKTTRAKERTPDA